MPPCNVCVRLDAFSQVLYVTSYSRESSWTRESKHADNSAPLTTLAVDLQDRHCSRELCVILVEHRELSDFSFFFSSSLSLSLSVYLPCLSCSISFGSVHGYLEFLRKLRRNRTVWLVRPTQFTWRADRGARKFQRDEYSMYGAVRLNWVLFLFL